MDNSSICFGLEGLGHFDNERYPLLVEFSGGFLNYYKCRMNAVFSQGVKLKIFQRYCIPLYQHLGDWGNIVA